MICTHRTNTHISCIAYHSLPHTTPQTKVTNANDSGEGSLRAAIEDSGTTSIEIDIKGRRIINIDSPLVYAGDGPLTITGDGNGKGNRPTIKGGDFDLLKVTSDLTVKNVDFEGPGDFSIYSQSIYSQSTESIPGKGIYVDIPSGAEGVIKVELEDVQVSNVANHGVHISDCSSETCGNGNTGDGEGSNASVHLVLKNVVVSNVGKGKFDGDGVRVDERGPGKFAHEISHYYLIHATANLLKSLSIKVILYSRQKVLLLKTVEQTVLSLMKLETVRLPCPFAYVSLLLSNI